MCIETVDTGHMDDEKDGLFRQGQRLNLPSSGSLSMALSWLSFDNQSYFSHQSQDSSLNGLSTFPEMQN